MKLTQIILPRRTDAESRFRRRITGTGLKCLNNNSQSVLERREFEEELILEQINLLSMTIISMSVMFQLKHKQCLMDYFHLKPFSRNIYNACDIYDYAITIMWVDGRVFSTDSNIL